MTDMELVRTYALSFLGKPYFYGGSTPMEGLDCSGLAIEVLKAFGLLHFHDDMNAAELSKRFPDLVSQADMGDLAFFGLDKEQIEHVGICLNESQMIEAGGGGPYVNDLKSAIDHQAFIKIRPIHYRKDFLFITRPNWGT